MFLRLLAGLRRLTGSRVLVLAVSAHVLAPASAQGQSTIDLPPRVRLSAGIHGALGGPAGAAGLFGAALYRDLLNPAVGILGVQAEVHAGASSEGRWLGDVAIGVRSPALALGTGLDVSLRSGRIAPFLSITHPLRRGGLLLPGGLLQATWLFGGESRARAGLTFPVAQPLIGRSRPRRDHVRLPPATERPAAREDGLRAWVLRVNEVVVPPLDDPTGVQALLETQRNASAIMAGYHGALERSIGRARADRLRAALLHDVLLPYNRLVGQKREPDVLAPLAAVALRSVANDGPAAVSILADVIAGLEEIIRIQRQRLRDERLVWLPLQLALRSEDHETQAQMDALLERITAGEFSDSNQLVYVPSTQFQWELNHSIRSAREYHVLWLHEFRGINDEGSVDGVAYRQVVHGYLTALLERVRAYDAERALPDYHLILDQYYFEQMRSRPWLQLLRDPLGARIRLQRAPPEWQTALDSIQAELRAAVARSPALQAEARTRGREWLQRRVSVNVHVTQQADPSFFSPGVLPIIGLTDNALRDHRKLVFYDLTETDPYRGALIVSGMGVGEIFARADWEDRAAILRGTAAHAVKRHAARLLTGNGLRAAELPRWLEPARDTVPLALRAPTPRFDPVPVTTMQLHNQVGYGDKAVTAAKALTYSLLPEGAVVKVANSLWLNPLWSSLLLGHALRGGRVLLISASLENSPFKPAEMSLVSEQLAQLLVARAALAPAIDRAGGMLRLGIYDVDLQVEDISARIDTALARRTRTPWLRELEPFSQEVLDSLRAVANGLRQTSGTGALARHVKAKLHLKAHFAASAEAWDNLFLQPGWGAALASYFRGRARLEEARPQYVEFHQLSPTTVTQVPGTLMLRREVMARRSELVLYYLMVGSFNEDYRSALLDGEAVLVIAGFGAAIGIADFILLPSLCTWIDTVPELHRHLPRRASWLTRQLRILY